jgi:hypothetical protein
MQAVQSGRAGNTGGAGGLSWIRGGCIGIKYAALAHTHTHINTPTHTHSHTHAAVAMHGSASTWKQMRTACMHLWKRKCGSKAWSTDMWQFRYVAERVSVCRTKMWCRTSEAALSPCCKVAVKGRRAETPG